MILAITGIIAAIVALSYVIGEFNQASARAYAEASEKLEQSQARLSNLNGLKSQFDQMQTSVLSGSKSIEEYSGLLSSLSEISPRAATAVANMKSGALTAQEGFAILNEELERVIANEQRISQTSFKTAMANYQLPDELKSVNDRAQSLSFLGEQYGVRRGASYNDYSTGLWDALYGGFLPEDIQDAWIEEINALVKKFGDDATKIASSPEGRAVLENVFAALFSDVDTAQAKLKAEFNKQADLMWSLLGDSISETQKKYASGVLYNMLAGEDGLLSVEELSGLGQLFNKVFGQVLTNGFDNTEFGNIGAAYISSALDLDWADLGQDEQNNITNGITSLLAAGVADVDLKSFLKSADTGADLVEQYVDWLKDQIWDKIDVESLSPDLVHTNDIDILEKIRQLVNLGVSAEDINKAFADSSS